MARMRITAFYDTNAEAERAAEALARQLGLDRARGAVRVHAAEPGAREDEGGFLDWLARVWRPEADFLPLEDRELLGEGLRRGGTVLSAEVQEGDLQRATQLLEDHGAVDLDTRAVEWREAGWAGGMAAPAGPDDAARRRGRVRSYMWEAPSMGAPLGPGGPPRV